jgi:hypothetical protein
LPHLPHLPKTTVGLKNELSNKLKFYDMALLIKIFFKIVINFFNGCCEIILMNHLAARAYNFKTIPN